MVTQKRRDSWDDPIGRWLPNAPADKRAITLRQLFSLRGSSSRGVGRRGLAFGLLAAAVTVGCSATVSDTTAPAPSATTPANPTSDAARCRQLQAAAAANPPVFDAAATWLGHARAVRADAADAVADFSRADHDQALHWIARTCGVPMTTGQLLEAL